jgi:ESCRT-II complex subunit VPS36
VLGLKLRKFDSGVLVIQEEVFDDFLMFERLVELAKQEPTEGISPTSVSHQLQVSLLVAKEQLLLAEKSGYLCRDDTLNGIFYFENLFPTFTLLL